MILRLLPLAALLLASAAGARDLGPVNGSFEAWGQAGPVGWTRVEGARTGEGEADSRWSVEAEAAHGTSSLRLSGDLSTRRWWAFVSEPVDVTPGRRLRLSGQIRTSGVGQRDGQFVNCNLGLRFEDAEGERVLVNGYAVVGTPLVTGTQGWTPVSRLFVVPAAAARVRVQAFLSMSGTAWFDDIRLSELPVPAWIRVETARFVFHEQEGDRLTEADRRANEANLADLEATLDLRLPVPVQFYKYRDVAQKEAVTGQAGNAHVEGADVVHTIWHVDRHELVHLLTRTVGRPESVLLGEGLAVHLTGDWQGRDLDAWVRQYHAEGRLPRLDELVDLTSFRRLDEGVAYPVAGSFVRWLVGYRGLSFVKSIYPAWGAHPDPDRFRERVQELYGASLPELERRWLTSLGLT